MNSSFPTNDASAPMFAPEGMGSNGHDALVPGVMTILIFLRDRGRSRPSSIDVTGFAVCAGRPRSQGPLQQKN